jgi:hypothetical protein
VLEEAISAIATGLIEFLSMTTACCDQKRPGLHATATSLVTFVCSVAPLVRWIACPSLLAPERMTPCRSPSEVRETDEMLG